MNRTFRVNRTRSLSIAFSAIAAAAISLSATDNSFAMGWKIAVINSAGEVWARDLSENQVGPGEKLSGPSLFGGPNDQIVLGTSEISPSLLFLMGVINVINTSGEVWSRYVNDTTVDAGLPLGGTLFGGSDAKYVTIASINDISAFFSRCPSIFYVINSRGEVWRHPITSDGVSGGHKLDGPSLFVGSNDKYVVLDPGAPSLLVINTLGEVWAHDLSGSLFQALVPGVPVCPNDFTTVGAGHKLNGPTLFSGPNDKYVVSARIAGINRLLVINTAGEVWLRDISGTTVGPGVKLDGPGLFRGSDDKYVVTYYATWYD